MRLLLEEIQATFDAGIWVPALIGCLLVPDACGAVEFAEYEGHGRNRRRYVEWFERYVGSVTEHDPDLRGSFLWKVRNGVIHEAGISFREFGVEQLVFMLPNQQRIHIGMIAAAPDGINRHLALDLGDLLARMRTGAHRWLIQIAADEAKQGRLNRLIQLRPNGAPPIVQGLPVIA